MGYWEAATAIVAKRGDAQLTNKEELQQFALESKKRADKFIQSLESSNRIQTYPPPSVIPAMQWAQSPDKIFLDIKFAHRFDAPGCIELKDQKIDFEKDKLKLSGLCTMSSHKMKYVVDFELYDAVNPDACTYSMSSVGRMTMTLEKVTKGYWKLPMKGKKPSNMQIWWEMKGKYKKDMKPYYPDDGTSYPDDDDEPDKKKDL